MRRHRFDSRVVQICDQSDHKILYPTYDVFGAQQQIKWNKWSKKFDERPHHEQIFMEENLM